MLIGVDATRAIRPVQTGTESYSHHVIEALLARPTEYHYRLYVDRDPGSLLPTSDRSDIRVVKLGHLWTHAGLGVEVLRRPPDLLFIPSHVMPLVCRPPAVAVIHDIGYLWYRSAYTPLAWLLLHLGTIRNARGAARIVVDSQATARDVIRHLGVLPARIRVAYLGGPAVRQVDPDPALQQRYDLPQRYFLFVGTLQPRKNVPLLLRAFALARRRSRGRVALALAGQAGLGADALKSLTGKLGISDDVRWLGYVPSEDRPGLYAAAAAFVFPSLYEGFGLPAVEAMAWGTPVIASNTSSLPEVVGDAGILVDPRDVDALAEAMTRVLDDSALSERLVTAGRVQAAHFRWEACAEVIESTFAESARWHSNCQRLDR
jgi:glycosyltransferase involved in cell wall biosynthesis